MPPRMTELGFLEHLAPRFHLPVPEHLTAEATGTAIRKAMDRWGGRALVKPDVMVGKRGKAGAVREVKDYLEAQKELKRVQGLLIDGRIARTA